MEIKTELETIREVANLMADYPSEPLTKKRLIEELTTTLDLMGQFWEDVKRSGTDIPMYELSEAICSLAHIIKEVEK
jgi:hypothetical protein